MTHLVKILHNKVFHSIPNATVWISVIPQNATYWRLGIGVVPNRTQETIRANGRKNHEKTSPCHLLPQGSPRLPSRLPPRRLAFAPSCAVADNAILSWWIVASVRPQTSEGLGSLKLDESMDRTGGRELHSFKLAMVPRRPASSLSIVGLWKWMGCRDV